ncbi:MAG: hypothetical protein KDA33_03075, partial [Phycisphaerales bacterium]|nr:hypothetical protein [Phycisphaerales bacterium]
LGIDNDSGAYDASPDGSTIVGFSKSSSTVGEAFRWTQSDGLVGLGQLPGGGTLSIATRISADSNVIVGYAKRSGIVYEGFRWTANGGMVGIGDLPGGSYWSEVWDTNDDGSVLVGFGRDATGVVATIWDESKGLRTINDYLANELGIDPGGWYFGKSVGVSGDGTRIVGVGVNPDGIGESWMIIVPEPGTSAFVIVAGLLMTRRRRR